MATIRQGKKKYKIQPIEKSPEIRDILSMPIIGQLDADDINGDKARMEYYKEKMSQCIILTNARL